jgi:hypothetical protein
MPKMPFDTHVNVIFDAYRPPAFKQVEPAGLPIATLDPTKVQQTESLTRMRKSYDEAQRQVQAASYDKMGHRKQKYLEGQLVDIEA